MTIIYLRNTCRCAMPVIVDRGQKGRGGGLGVVGAGGGIVQDPEIFKKFDFTEIVTTHRVLRTCCPRSLQHVTLT